jgi:hypothetical protein
MLQRILLPFKLFWFGCHRAGLFGENTFISLSKLLEYILKVSIEDKPFLTHVTIGEKRIVSLWAYPGVSKNPIDRIAELLQEIEALKEMANKEMANKAN